jgi:hypothetical protein
MLDCSAGSPVTEELSLAIPEPAKIPNEEWIIEMATAIAAMIMDKRLKTIFEIDARYRADRMHDQGKFKSVRTGNHLTSD